MVHPSGKEIVISRIGGAIFWNIVFQIGLLKIFVLIINVNFTNPFLWIRNVTGSIFSFETWLYIIPVVFVTFAQGIVSCKEYLFPPVCASNRLSRCRQVFGLHNISIGFLYAYIGLSIPYIYSSDIEGYSSLTVPCDDKTCFSENKMFLVLGGAWTALYYFVHYHLLQYRYLTFPFIQRHKFLVFKGVLLPVIKSGLKYTIGPVCSYALFYSIKGDFFKNFFYHLFNVRFYPDNLDTFVQLFDVTRLLYLWLFCTIIFVTLKMMEIMVKLFLTQRQVFPASINPTEPSGYFILEEALMRSDRPIIQHLGYLDLCLVAEMDKSRRQEIFTLSQPGGHPYTWNGIKKECFFMINTFIASLNQAMNKPIKITQVNRSSEPINPKHECIDYFISSDQRYPVFCTETFSIMVRSLRNFVVDWVTSRISVFMELRAIKYLCGEVLEFRINYLLIHSLPVLWAAESLSHLVCFSLDEDEYGIVQNDIPQVISCLINLKNSVETLLKHPTLITKGYKFDNSVLKMHTSLLNSSKRSLYRITVKFRPFINDLQLSREYERQLSSFLNFRE